MKGNIGNCGAGREKYGARSNSPISMHVKYKSGPKNY